MALQYQDTLFQIDVGLGEKQSLKEVLSINKSPGGHTNDFGNGSTVIINSDRLILNAKKDHLFVCGKDGVTITSPKEVHVDATGDVFLFSETGEVYIGLPNRGKDYDFKDQLVPKTKGDATRNTPYEPLVLGLKLANLLEDLLVLLRDAVVRTPAGDGYMSAEVMYNLENLHSRIPEMLSTVAFIDGVSHETPDAAPPVPEDVLSQVTRDASLGSPGSTTSGASTTNTDTNTSNTQSPAGQVRASVNSTNPDGVVTPGPYTTTSTNRP